MGKKPEHKPTETHSKFRQESLENKPSEKLRDKPGTSGQVDPKFADRENPLPKEDIKNLKQKKAAAKENKQIHKSKLRAEKSGDKLDKARNKSAKKKPYKPPGAIKRLRQAVSSEAALQVHRKIREVEGDNVGVEAAHETELQAERAGRAAIYHVKQRIRSRHYSRVKKAEHKNIKAQADHRFREMAKENPELKKNALKRYWHKKRIQRKFRKQAQQAAKKSAAAGKQSGRLLFRVGRAVFRFIRRNPKLMLILAIAFALVLIIQSCTALTMTLFSNVGGGAIGASTYLSEDEEILAAQAAYAEMEAELQYLLDNYETLNPGYDEYRYNLDTIWHDPYVLISIISAYHDGAWTLPEVQSRLTMLFERQYTLTETVTVQVRYRTETHTDTWIDEDGIEQTETYDVEVAYDYYIITVTLENFNLSHLPIHIMSHNQLSRYALYMATLGNRPDLFPVSLFPRASFYREFYRYEIPPEHLQDEVFAAMIAEANKYLGYPYIWGGYSPATSFDCSGFVSWVINNSGWNVGRLGAQGLYNICTPVSASNARPGDLVFFIGTYNTPGVSHVGIYAGNGWMVHAGNPIGYVSINTAYWQNHFFAFGRLP